LKDRFSLSKKNVLITGGAGFLAKFHIQALIEKKAKIFIVDKNYSGLIKRKKNFSKYKNIHIFKCDITNKNELIELNNRILNKFSKIDVLINNAFNDYKINKKRKYKNSSEIDIGINSWNEDVDIGLTGTLNCIEIFSKSMLKNKKGIILNIGSDLSIISPNQNLYNHLKVKKPVSYSVTKHGLIGMTKYFATLWAKKGIRINTLSPGAIDSNQDKEFKDKIKKLIPMGRMCKAHEILEIVQFLCSDASSYMTGQNIILDGGRSVW